MSEEFTFLGLTIPKLATYEGSFLVGWGILAYFLQSADPPSFTAMIPAFMVLGGARVITGFDTMSGLAIGSHIILILTGVCFMTGGIMSFRHARKSREG